MVYDTYSMHNVSGCIQYGYLWWCTILIAYTMSVDVFSMDISGGEPERIIVLL